MGLTHLIKLVSFMYLITF